MNHTRGRTQRYASLSGSHETSVAIVGGGMTGALVAHAFASAGIATTVVEADLVGRGSTAASSALLLQEPDLELRQLEERYGRRSARRIWRASHESVQQLIGLLRRLKIDCTLTKRDAVYYGAKSDETERLYREFKLRCQGRIRSRLAQRRSAAAIASSDLANGGVSSLTRRYASCVTTSKHVCPDWRPSRPNSLGRACLQ